MTETVFSLFGQDVTRFALGCTLSLCMVLLIVFSLAQQASGRCRLTFSVLALTLAAVFSRGLYCAAECFTAEPMDSFAQVLDVAHGGFSIMGVLAGMVLAAYLAQKLCHEQGQPLIGALAVAMPAGLLMERISEIGTGAGLGREVPEWLTAIAVEDPVTGVLVHPVYVYEAAAAGIMLLVMAVLWFRRKQAVRGMDAMLVFLTLFGASQVFLEAFRFDMHMYIHFVQVEQVIAILLVVIPLCVWSHGSRNHIGKGRMALLHVLFLVICGLTVLMEFRLDRGEHKLLYYTVIALCMAGAGMECLLLRRAAIKEE